MPGLFLTHVKTLYVSPLYVSPPSSVLPAPAEQQAEGAGGHVPWGLLPWGACCWGQEYPEVSEQSGAPQTPGWLVSPCRSGRDAGMMEGVPFSLSLRDALGFRWDPPALELGCLWEGKVLAR